VEYYDFEVIKGDVVISAETFVALENSRAAWPKVLKIAHKLDLPGCRIRVREHEGETVILIGAAAARSFPEIAFSA
jgi:hypothetical protein